MNMTAKDILLEELKEQIHPVLVENVIYKALDKYRNEGIPAEWSTIIAHYICDRMDTENQDMPSELVEEPNIGLLDQMGFKRIKEYEHDRFTTHVFEKGHIQVDMTYDQNGRLTWDVTLIDLPDMLNISLKELRYLVLLLGKKRS